MCDCLSEAIKTTAIFITEDTILGHASLKYRDLTNDFLNKVKVYHSEKYENLNISKDVLEYKHVFVSPVVNESQFTGAFILLSNSEINETSSSVCETFASLLTILSQH